MPDREHEQEPPFEAGKRRIAHYEITGEIGRGGMGIVYRARDLNLGRDVALKCPWRDGPADPDLKSRFLREARAASSLSHSNIVPVYEEFEVDGQPWLAMELVDGESLRDHIRRRGALPADEILRHALGLAEALQVAHNRRILHRDITPRNILVGRDGRARLMDFGLARHFVPPGHESTATTESSQLTQAGTAVGTPGYVSPEQSLGKRVDARSDIFSLGAVLYEMCTSRHAFAGSDRGAVMDAILNQEPVAIGRLNYGIPAELERIVRKCLEKDPDLRYQDTQDLIADIRALRRRRRGEAPAGRRAGRRWTWLAALLAASVAGTLVVWFWYLGPEDPSGEFKRPAQVFYERGLHYYSKEDWDPRNLSDAIQMFNRAIELDAGFAAAYAALGEAYWVRYSTAPDSDTAREAAGAVDQALRLEPDLAEAHMAKGYGFLVQGEHEAAREELAIAVKAKPELDGAWACLGRACQYLGDYSAALRAFRRATQLRPDKYKHLIWLGLFFDQYSEYAEAVEAFDAAVKIKPDSTEGWNNLAATYLKMGRNDDAVTALRRSLEIEETPTGRTNLGTIYYFQGKYSEAVEQYRSAAALEPDEAVHWANMGDALQVQGLPAEAREAYLEAVSRARSIALRSPMSPTAHMRLGLYCARAQLEDCALTEGRRAAEMQPDSAEILFRVAIIHSLADRPEEAIRWLEQAVRLGLTRGEMENDPDLGRLESHPRYKTLLALAG